MPSENKTAESSDLKQEAEQAYLEMKKAFTEVEDSHNRLIEAELLFIQKTDEYKKAEERQKEEKGKQQEKEENQKEDEKQREQEKEEKEQAENEKTSKENAEREEEKEKQLTAAAIAAMIIAGNAAIVIPTAMAGAVVVEVAKNIEKIKDTSVALENWTDIAHAFQDRPDIRQDILIPAGAMIDKEKGIKRENPQKSETKEQKVEAGKTQTKSKNEKTSQFRSFEERIAEVTGEEKAKELIRDRKTIDPRKKPLAKIISEVETERAVAQAEKEAAKAKAKEKKKEKTATRQKAAERS